MRTVAENILAQYRGQFGKDTTSAYHFSNAGAAVIPLPDAVKVWGGVNTPLLQRVGNERAVAITDEWEDVQIAAAAENAQVEGILASALTGVAATPVVRTNTCQIVSDKIPVTGSALREARNGIYGRALQDLMAFQIRVRLPQIIASIELSALFGVEVTQASAGDMSSARKMSGLVGTVGAAGFDDGLLTTTGRATNTSLSGAELTQDLFDTWLETIAGAGASANDLPTAVYCSLKAQRKIGTFENTIPVQSDVPTGTADVMVGRRVTRYWAPWGAAIDIVWEPQCAYSATAANNWLSAFCEPNITMRSLAGSPTEGGIEIIELPVAGDLLEIQFLWEGTIKAEVFKGHGNLYNFTLTL
jgi:hypothetical protein